MVDRRVAVLLSHGARALPHTPGSLRLPHTNTVYTSAHTYTHIHTLYIERARWGEECARGRARERIRTAAAALVVEKASLFVRRSEATSPSRSASRDCASRGVSWSRTPYGAVIIPQWIVVYQAIYLSIGIKWVLIGQGYRQDNHQTAS